MAAVMQLFYHAELREGFKDSVFGPTEFNAKFKKMLPPDAKAKVVLKIKKNRDFRDMPSHEIEAKIVDSEKEGGKPYMTCDFKAIGFPRER